MYINKRKGFIALFFILILSSTFYAWMETGSRLIFTYIQNKKTFTYVRDDVKNTLLCIEFFSERYPEQVVSFDRDMYVGDDYVCTVDSIESDPSVFIIDSKAKVKVVKIHGFIQSVFVEFL